GALFRRDPLARATVADQDALAGQRDAVAVQARPRRLAERRADMRDHFLRHGLAAVHDDEAELDRCRDGGADGDAEQGFEQPHPSFPSHGASPRAPGSCLSKRVGRTADPIGSKKCRPIAAIFRQKKSPAGAGLARRRRWRPAYIGWLIAGIAFFLALALEGLALPMSVVCAMFASCSATDRLACFTPSCAWPSAVSRGLRLATVLVAGMAPLPWPLHGLPKLASKPAPLGPTRQL